MKFLNTCFPDASSYVGSMLDGGQRSSKRDKKRKKKSKSRVPSFVEQYEEESDSNSDLQSYLAIGSSNQGDEQLRMALAGMINGPQSGVGSSTGSFTLPMKNSTAGDLMKTFMGCQNCSEISTQSKQLQCSHTICQKCAMQLRSKHVDPGM